MNKISYIKLSQSVEVTLTRWRSLKGLRTRGVIQAKSVSLTGRFNHAGQAFLEKPDYLLANSKGTDTMAL